LGDGAPELMFRFADLCCGWVAYCSTRFVRYPLPMNDLLAVASVSPERAKVQAA
jgi:hypothetical protein